MIQKKWKEAQNMKMNAEHTACSCGRKHEASLDEVVSGPGVLRRLPELIARCGAKRPFVLADRNTYAAAGEQVCRILEQSGLPFGKYVFDEAHLEPDERAVGAAVMHFDAACDLIVGVGSGVINDIGKILSCLSGKKYIIVATAPSMDGYASATSSMSRDGLKISLPTRCADVIVGDTEILKNAPLRMLRSGLGDMLAKYVSIAEWRIAHIITGEYYCENVAQMVRQALQKCVENADGLLRREDAAVQAVFDGLVAGGVAMAYAGVSRPASGVEHYFSHVWDMWALEFGTPAELHGIQCAIGTLAAVRLYERVRTIRPDAERAAAWVAAFDYDDWAAQLRGFLGKSAETMIALEQREGKYSKTAHPVRFARICAHWDEILRILDEELPRADELEALMERVGLPKDASCIGVDRAGMQMTFRATKDIRDKYVLSRLAWDLGILEELCESL